MNTHNELFIGRLGINPKLKYTQTQKAVCELSVGVDNGADQKTTWKKVIVWGKQAENCNLYLRKGAEVFVQGRKEFKEYTDKKTGELKKYEEFIARLVGFANL
ncbi:MAG: single-strand DNA-binding protein [Bacteriovoracaceae bacterium]|jgi:single-strand DNA-binding protein